MNVVLANIILWPFILLVGVPLLLHLFARTRPPVYDFSSLEFILKIIRQTNRIKRPQDWILLLIRTLIFAAVIFIFLQPLFFSKRKLSSPFERKNVVLVVDATASMAYNDGAQTRFASACAEASEVLSGLSARDTADIVWLKAKPAAIFPQLGVNFSHLQSELRRARVTSEAGDVAEAMRLARSLLESAEGRREICVISDFQRTGWEKTDLQSLPGMDLIKVKIGQEAGINGAVSDIFADPSKPLAGEEISVCCDIYNYSAQPRRRTVYLNIQDNRQSQDVLIPAWNKNTAVFRYRFNSPGIFPVRVTLSEDTFAGDDSRYALVEVRDALHVAIVGNDSVTARAWKRALDAVGWAKTELLADVSGPAPRDVVMLAGDDGTNLAKCMDRLREGCTIVWAPSGAGAKLVVPGNSNQPPVELVWEDLKNPGKLRVAAEKDGIFRLFSDGARGDPARGLFNGRLNVKAAALAGGDVLLAYEDGVPALVRFRQRGALFFWNLPLKPEFSDYAKQAEYLPLLAELLLVSRTGGGKAENTADFLAGERLSWRLDEEVPAIDVKLTGPAGESLGIEERRTSRDINLVALEQAEPGLYSWAAQGRTLGHSIVNFPVVESDLRALSMQDLESHGSVSVREGRTVRLLREGIKLWPILLGLAVALALVEGLALLWMERT